MAESSFGNQKLVQKPSIKILPQVVHKSLTKMRLRGGNRMMPKLNDASPAIQVRQNCAAWQPRLRKAFRQFPGSRVARFGGGAAWKQFLMRSKDSSNIK
jgi:hypothetical protein